MSTAIYVRVSTERQTLAQTIEQQVERLTAQVHAQGEMLRSEDIFRDAGYRGATLNRPGLDRLRDRIKEATIERVIITSPDRLARNDVQQMVLLEEFERAGCRIEFLDQPLGQDPQAHLLRQIRGAVAEYERTLIAERMRRGRQMKLRAGILLPWTIPPYGYRMHPDRAGRRGHRPGNLCPLSRSGWHPARSGQALTPARHRVSARESALECGFPARAPVEPGLHREGLCWPYPRQASPYPTVRDPSLG